MELGSNIENINGILGNIPEYLYHGRIGDDISIENNNFDVIIYSDKGQTRDINFWDLKGRTNLDFAFHGFYLTPCEALARKWAYAKYPKDNEYYQILKYKVNYSILHTLKSNTLIVPDSTWAEYVFRNRAKMSIANEYDFVYGFIADGIMAGIHDKIGNKPYDIQSFHYDIMKEQHKRFLDDYYGGRKFKCSDIVASCGLKEYHNYQLCICSKRALKMIDLVDIIKVDRDTYIPDNINLNIHLNDYKVFVPKDLTNLIEGRGGQYE